MPVAALDLQVKITLQPMTNVLPETKRDAFEDAYRFYGEAVGMSKSDLTALGGKTESIGEVVRIYYTRICVSIYVSLCASGCGRTM